MIAHLLELGRVFEGIGAAIGRIDALEVQIATAVAWLLTIAPDLSSLAFITGDRDVSVSFGPRMGVASNATSVVCFALLARSTGLGRVVVVSIACHTLRSFEECHTLREGGISSAVERGRVDGIISRCEN
jgi:hypothetical protein